MSKLHKAAGAIGGVSFASSCFATFLGICDTAWRTGGIVTLSIAIPAFLIYIITEA